MERAARGACGATTINMEREKLGLVVMMWAPAHKGGSVSAYADAAAKAGAAASARGSGGVEYVCGHLPRGRGVLTVRGARTTADGACG